MILFFSGLTIGFIAGGLTVWDLIKRYRNKQGLPEDPLEPNVIHFL